MIRVTLLHTGGLKLLRLVERIRAFSVDLPMFEYGQRSPVFGRRMNSGSAAVLGAFEVSSVGLLLPL